jgi:hypothetical protein
MNRTMNIIVLALVMVLPATSWADLGIAGWFTNNAEFQCNEYERTTLLDDAKVRLSLGDNNSIWFSNMLTNNPPTWLDLISDLSCTRDLLLDSHGAMELGGYRPYYSNPTWTPVPPGPPLTNTVSIMEIRISPSAVIS